MNSTDDGSISTMIVPHTGLCIACCYGRNECKSLLLFLFCCGRVIGISITSLCQSSIRTTCEMKMSFVCQPVHCLYGLCVFFAPRFVSIFVYLTSFGQSFIRRNGEPCIGEHESVCCAYFSCLFVLFSLPRIECVYRLHHTETDHGNMSNALTHTHVRALV